MVTLATGVASVVIAQQIAAKAVRDGLFLSEFEVTALPYVMVVSALISLVSALGVGRLIASFSPGVAVPVIFGLNALLFLAEAAAVGESTRVVAAALYLHVAAFGGAVVSGFWSVVNEAFDPYAARRVIGRIAGGATAGGVVGGALTWVFATLPTPALLAGLAGANVLCGLAIARVAHESARGEADGDQRSSRAAGSSMLDGFRVLAGSSYPRAIAILVFLIALTTGLVDYVFKAGVTDAVSREGLVGFFAVFYTGTGIATFLVQVAGSRHTLRHLGVVGTVGVLPAVLALLLLAAIFVPGVTLLIVLRGAGMVVENSFYRSGYELLYTAVPKAQKRSAKILIDLGCDRLGTAASSGLALLAIGAAAASANQLLLTGAALVAGVTLAMLVMLQREYVGSLARQLRSALETGPLPDEQSPAMAMTFAGGFEDVGWDPGTASWSAGPETTGWDRGSLMTAVEDRAREKADSAPIAAPDATHARAPTPGVTETLLASPLRSRMADALREGSDGSARAALGRTAPAAIGQLTDILLSRRAPIDVRVLAAELLSEVPAERVVSGLVRGLAAGELRVRRAAALALLRVTTRAPHLRPPMRPLKAIASEELKRPSRPRDELSDFELASPFRTDGRGVPIAASLELALLLLAVEGDAPGLRLALSAVTSKDPVQRGTGLEYLDNLLPGNLRTQILGLVEHPERTQARVRVPHGVVRGLAEELRARRVDLAELRRRYRLELQERYDR